MLADNSLSKGKSKATFESDEEPFLSVLLAGGISFNEDGEACIGILSIEHQLPDAQVFAVRRRLSAALKQRGHVPATVRRVADGLAAFCDGGGAAAAGDSFCGAELCGGGAAAARLASVLVDARGGDAPANASVVKILLSVHELQNKMIDWIADNVTAFMSFHIPENLPLHKNLPLLLLHQFRFMDYVVDPQFLTEKLVSLLLVTRPHVQVHKLLIDVIPEILPDSGLEVMVEALSGAMEFNPSVTPFVLDVLSTIGVPSEMLV
ncbi:hypothetical protein BDR26DRAFT_901722 [Obelidium mucronatum]|nr:hypothetical protein BDR26DRAFT_901722 [Obelidium mucronatum]